MGRHAHHQIIERGGHVRVGLEHHAGDGRPGNVELVEATVDIVRAAGARPATTGEAAAILELPRRRASRPLSPAA